MPELLLGLQDVPPQSLEGGGPAASNVKVKALVKPSSPKPTHLDRPCGAKIEQEDVGMPAPVSVHLTSARILHSGSH